jgi:TPR repeat protein
MCYETGAGVPKSDDDAVSLYKQAAARGNADAAARLRALGLGPLALTPTKDDPAAVPRTATSSPTLSLGESEEQAALPSPLQRFFSTPASASGSDAWLRAPRGESDVDGDRDDVEPGSPNSCCASASAGGSGACVYLGSCVFSHRSTTYSRVAPNTSSAPPANVRRASIAESLSSSVHEKLRAHASRRDLAAGATEVAPAAVVGEQVAAFRYHPPSPTDAVDLLASATRAGKPSTSHGQ